MKEEMSAFDVRAAVRELRTMGTARLDKAYEITHTELLLRLRALEPARRLDLVILVGKALHLSDKPRETPEKPTPFIMQIRKALLNGFVDDVRQHGFDRVVEIVSNRKDGKYLLVVEMFHDGNVILVKDGKILTALSQQSWATREVRPGAPWVPPPARADPDLMSGEEFLAKMRASNADAVRTLATEINLGGPLAEEICARAEVPKSTSVAALSDAQIAALLDALRALMLQVDEGALDPVIVKRNGKNVDVSPFPLAAHAGAELVPFPTFHEALDAYFSRAPTGERVDPRLKKLASERQKVQRMLDAQTAALDKFEKEEVESRRKGDLLYAHFAPAQKVAAALLEASKGVGWKAVAEKVKEGVVPLVESVSPHEGTAILALEDENGKKVKVRIDVRKSVQENADALYENGKKFRSKREGAKVALVRTKARMKELDERGEEIAAALLEKQKAKPPTRRFWFENFRWTVTSDGHLVIAGRDARSNEKLVAKSLEDSDRYLHAEVSGAPSTVVKAKDGAVSATALDEAACFAASMSRIWNAGHASGTAYWVTPQQVSKTPNPGEFVAKGAFIIRGKRNFLRVPIRLAVGEVEIEGARKIMGGPVPALAARSTRYLVLEPGDLATNQLANELSEVFGVNVEEVQAVLPPAGVKIVERVGL